MVASCSRHLYTSSPPSSDCCWQQSGCCFSPQHATFSASLLPCELAAKKGATIRGRCRTSSRAVCAVFVAELASASNFRSAGCGCVAFHEQFRRLGKRAGPVARRALFAGVASLSRRIGFNFARGPLRGTLLRSLRRALSRPLRSQQAASFGVLRVPRSWGNAFRGWFGDRATRSTETVNAKELRSADFVCRRSRTKRAAAVQ